ncbi:MAG: matrixin family metalloprotease [Planctomycetota bacterium]
MNCLFPPKGLRAGGRCLAVISLLFIGWHSAIARADVVVLANRGGEPVSARLVLNENESPIKIPAGQQVVMRARGACKLLYELDNEVVRYRLDPNSVYFFSTDDQGAVDFHKVDLNDRQPLNVRSSNSLPVTNRLAELPVKILVDNRDPRPREVWEPLLRKRIRRVSRILRRHCRLELEIVAVETWDSGTHSVAFKQSLVDFRSRIDPHPARLAIGFTGRYEKKKRVHLGATHGMLQSHILIREWAASMTEAERTEVLLHEIGHYLGAVHSADKNSVMRPVLADEQAVHRAFRIGFDPVNTLIINLVSDEIRSAAVDSVTSLSPSGRGRLKQIYEALSTSLPKDKCARQFLFQLESGADTSLSQATRRVVREVHRAARSRQLHVHAASTKVSRDELTELYIRRAARAATKLGGEIAPSAFLLGLGVAMDDSDILLSNPVTANFCRKVESTTERRERRRILGTPTLRGRRDLAQHFFLSAYLTVAVGARAAESAGLAKELADSRSQSGFSYRDLAANAAGIRFAEHLLEGTWALSDVADGLATSDLMPKVADLPEGVRWQDIGSQRKSPPETGMEHYRTLIRERLRKLSEQPVESSKAVSG